MQSFLDTPISYLKGVGPQRAELLQRELNIFKFEDLLTHFPNRYIDKRKVTFIRDMGEDSSYVQVRGILSRPAVAGARQGKRLVAQLTDKNGDALELIWFKGIPWVQKALKPGSVYTVFGKLNEFKGKLSIPHPELELYNPDTPADQHKIVPVYPLTETLRSRGLDSKQIFGLINTLTSHPDFAVEEFIPADILKTLKLPERETAYRNIHAPQSFEAVQQAERRIKFEEMFVLSMRSEKTKVNRGRALQGIRLDKIGEAFNNFYHEHLPFALTNAQKRVLKEIRADVKSGRQMNRLLQGDVGSGKTVIALMTMLMAIDNGCQACMMAPTEILATQHFESLKDLLGDMPVTITLLTGSTSKKNRTVIHQQLADGSLQILVGTHALVEDNVVFNTLGMVVIDEQHRFGVEQRARLWFKAKPLPHVLVMTATPIPRTLAMTVHGELDVSVIDELPAGRKPIRTVHRDESYRGEVMEFIRTQITEGRQAYFVYPLIEESAKLELQNLMDGYEQVTDFFPVPKYQVSMVHGRMKPEEKDREMQRFKKGVTNIMVATTVIEVGVNVPNATVMVVESAERFGLSQLHQLRGRVGRGGNQSFCILMTKGDLNYPAKQRLKAMTTSTDGFHISRVDLQLRGPGDVLGTRQSGLPDFKLLDLVKDEAVIEQAKQAAQIILERDPDLKLRENEALMNYLLRHQSDNFWGRVS